MTNLEALQATLGFSLDSTSIDKALIDAGITGSSTYTVSMKTSINIVALDLLQLLLSTPDIMEGDYSVKYDRGAIEARINILSNILGIIVLQPTIKGVSPW